MKVMISTLSLAVSLALAGPAEDKAVGQYLAGARENARPHAGIDQQHAHQVSGHLRQQPLVADLGSDHGGAAEGEREGARLDAQGVDLGRDQAVRSEEHTSELQSLMRLSYAVFCLKKKTNNCATRRRPRQQQT